MKHALLFTTRALFSGLLIVVPIYLATLLVLKGMKSVAGLVRPIAMLLPETIPAETVLSLLLVMLLCFLVGVAVLTRAGKAARDKIEKTFFERIPGYMLFRSLTQQLAGESRENVWKPALIESDKRFQLAFIIEELEDGRYTIFVPSVPTPISGAVFIIEPSRVHPLNIPVTEAIKAISRWGSGAKELFEAMQRGKKASSTEPASGVGGAA